jgi:hypothetical protein
MEGLIGIERKGRYHRVYYLLKLKCQLSVADAPMTTNPIEETQVSTMKNPDVNQVDNNDNNLKRNINDIDNKKTIDNKYEKEFIPRTREERLALDLADALNDRKGLAMYLAYTRRFPESLLRKALGEAKEIPEKQIRKSRAALFNHLVRKYVREYKNHRGQPWN